MACCSMDDINSLPARASLELLHAGVAVGDVRQVLQGLHALRLEHRLWRGVIQRLQAQSS